MNIWFFSHYAGTPREPGDTKDYYFVRELGKAGIGASVFASAFNHRSRENAVDLQGKHRQEETVNGARFIWVRTLPYYEGNNWRRALNMLSYFLEVVPVSMRFVRKGDVIIGVTPHPLCAMAAWLVSRSRGAGFILDVRDLWPETLVAIGGYRRNSPTVRILAALEKFLYRHADRIIYVMPNAEDYMASLGIPRNKIACIPNGVDVDLYDNTEAAMPEDLDSLIRGLKDQHRIIVGYIGAHGTADALHTVIDAASHIQNSGFRDIFFVLVGDGPDKRALIEKAGRLGLSNISFHDPIPKFSLPAFLRSTDAVIVTKQKTDLYRFGMSFLKLYDYMMSAKPVIWAVESINNPVDEAGCGISAEPENARAVAEAVLKICRMTQQDRQLMGMRGRDYVIKYHSSPVLTQRLLKIINEFHKR
jgi:glycosyltransferase involved in cell wall biosynthesis